MSELSPRARALVQAHRKAVRPSVADRDRIEAALRNKLGESAFAPELARSATWKIIAGAALGVCLVGVSLSFLPRSLPERSQPPVAQTTPALPQPSVASQPPLPAATPLPPPAAALKPKPRASSARDSLAIEVELLSAATSALRSGNFTRALETLNEYKRRFPRGRLQEESRIARAQALCGAGRVSDGRAELERLPPDTPATARARRTCDAR